MMLDYEALFAALERSGVRYLLTGATRVLSRADLIATKEGSPRRQDLCDVEALRRMEGGS